MLVSEKIVSSLLNLLCYVIFVRFGYVMLGLVRLG